jgi:glycerophosphoryl diester phosphodiesterase
VRRTLLSLTIAICAAATAQATDRSRVDQIRERLENANLWRDHVMVVGHRGGGMDGWKSRYPENSIAAVENAIALGAEMVELDVRLSRDGVLIVFHDSWLDRTTDCTGEVEERTLAELRTCHLVVEATGVTTSEVVPTLSEMFSVVKGRILVNIDNKVEADALPAIARQAREAGVADQIVIKANLWNAQRIADVKAVMRGVGPDILFMPIIADDAVRDAGFLETATSAFAADAAELIIWHREGEPLTSNGGPLFAAKARAVASRGDWHLWVNTYAIANKPGGMLAGGRGDELATLASVPHEAYGFWIDRGATIIQTDEPTALIEWLTDNGYRVPYAAVRQPVAALAPSN